MAKTEYALWTLSFVSSGALLGWGIRDLIRKGAFA